MSLTIENLVDEFYEQLNKITSGEIHKKGIKRPDIANKDRKTYIENFEDLCKSIDRTTLQLSNYYAEELKTTTSVTENGMLIINSTEKKAKIEELFKKYITTHVQCKICKSCDTDTMKEKKITFIVCKKCRAKSAIDN